MRAYTGTQSLQLLHTRSYHGDICAMPASQLRSLPRHMLQNMQLACMEDTGVLCAVKCRSATCTSS